MHGKNLETLKFVKARMVSAQKLVSQFPVDRERRGTRSQTFSLNEVGTRPEG